MESFSRFDGILNGNDLRTIDALEFINDGIIVTLRVVELINEEDDRFTEFFGVAEMILRTDFGTKLAVDKQHSGIRHVE